MCAQRLGSELSFVVSHPSDEVKDVARVGHPCFVQR
jgi:hypothetical protein